MFSSYTPLRSSLFAPLLFIALTGTGFADLAWVDIDDPAGMTESGYLSLAGSNGSSATNLSGLTFTVFGDDLGSRDRGGVDVLLSDFVFDDGIGGFIGLRIAGLPAGVWDVESLHYDEGGFPGSVKIELRDEGDVGSTQVLVANAPFSTTATTYQITSDGSTTYELIYTEDDGENRSRLNGLRIRAVGGVVSPPFVLTNATDANTTAVGGTPDPFDTSSSSDTDYTTGNLWLKRPGFGFDAAGNSEIYQKDASGAVGDAAALQTVISGLVPGRSYGVHAAFISVPAENWQVKGSLDGSSYQTFTPTTPAGSVFDLGQSAEAGSNRNQYIGFIGNATADGSGMITVYADDGDGTGNTSRTWYEGVGVSNPMTVPEVPGFPAGAVTVASDGVWTWFNDERAIFHNGYLYAGYVRSDGHVGISRLDPATTTTTHVQLSTAQSVQVDDHNNPSLTPLADGRLLAVYSKHNAVAEFYSRTSLNSTPSGAGDWAAEQVYIVPQKNTYANTFRLSGESDAIYMFHRCINFNPTISRSYDDGGTWDAATHFIKVGNDSSIRPYPRYVSNHVDRVDLIYTEGHPRAEDNSIYHMYYESGAFRKTDGTLIKNITALPIDHSMGEQGSVVYAFSNAAYGAGDGPDDWIPTGRGWTWDIHYGTDGHPVCAFQVQRDNTTGTGWTHDRIYYYYARWDGSAWSRKFIAQAGRPIYSGERDYGGGMCIDPEDPRVVYIASNAEDPFALGDIDNVPLNADSRYELYRGVTLDGGQTFTWEAVTDNSEKDNLRPVIPENHGYDHALVWFYGTYTTYQNYNTQVLALLENDLEVSNFAYSPSGLSLSWGSRVGASYNVMAGTDLTTFDVPVMENLTSQGALTTQAFTVPAALDTEPKVFFRVEED